MIWFSNTPDCKPPVTYPFYQHSIESRLTVVDNNPAAIHYFSQTCRHVSTYEYYTNQEKTQLFSAALFELSMILAISLLSVPQWSIVVSSNELDILELSRSSPRPYANAYHTSEVNFCLMRRWELTAHCTHWAFKKALNQVVSMIPPL